MQGDVDLLIFPRETYLVRQAYVLPVRNIEMGQSLRTRAGNPAAILPNWVAAQGAWTGIFSHYPFFSSGRKKKEVQHILQASKSFLKPPLSFSTGPLLWLLTHWHEEAKIDSEEVSASCRSMIVFCFSHGSAHDQKLWAWEARLLVCYQLE